MDTDIHWLHHPRRMVFTAVYMPRCLLRDTAYRALCACAGVLRARSKSHTPLLCLAAGHYRHIVSLDSTMTLRDEKPSRPVEHQGVADVTSHHTKRRHRQKRGGMLHGVNIPRRGDITATASYRFIHIRHE